MTKNKAHDVQNYSFVSGEKIVVDANIWLSLFPAPSDSNRNSSIVYSSVFKNMLSAGAIPSIGAIVLSEYLNRYCRIEFEALHKGKYRSFKQFRQSPDYASVGSTAVAYAEQILKHSVRYDDDFVKADLDAVLSDFGDGSADFNDGVIAQCCSRNGFKLLTHDGDFVNGGIDVLTCNKKLLLACA